VCESPDGNTIGIEIPAKVKQATGLDDARRWVIVSEHNIPPGLFAQIKARFLELARQNKSGVVRR
jgi:hypothetical protein